METLYYARMKRNISETEMAKAAGIPTATYRRYETRPNPRAIAGRMPEGTTDNKE